MIGDIYFNRHVFVFEAIDKIGLPPYKGSTFRGGFGHAFKAVSCTLKKTRCEDCILKAKCAYSYIFETPLPEDSEVLRNYQTIPHPFIIEPLDGNKPEFLPGDALSLGLVLVGRAIDYLPYFILAFEELGGRGIGKGRGKYKLKEVLSLSPDVREEIIYTNVDKRLKRLAPIYMRSLQTKQSFETPLTIDFLTPVRILNEGALVSSLDFHHMVRSLLRRASALSYFHCGKRLEADFKGLIERAHNIRTVNSTLKWHDWERYSQRQECRMKLGGLIGRISFEGVIDEFTELIRFGEIVHAGKGTSFGLGRYKIQSIK